MTAPSSTPKIQLIGVKKRFGPKVVLDGVDLTIDKQSSVVIIGGSGTGKSVLLRSIVGLRRPTSGQVHVFGQDILSLTPEKRSQLERRFGVLFQNGALFSSLNIVENIYDFVESPKTFLAWREFSNLKEF